MFSYLVLPLGDAFLIKIKDFNQEIVSITETAVFSIRHIGNIQNLTKSLYSTVNRMDYFQAAPVLLRLCYTITPVQID